MAQLVPKSLTAPLGSGSNPAHQLGKVVALLIVRGNLAAGGGGGRYLSDHGSGQIFTVLVSFSSSVTSSISGLGTQHLVLIATPIYCKRASSDSMRASMLLLAVHRQQTSLEYCYACGTCYCLGDLAKYLEDCIVYRPLSEDDLEQDQITYINR